MSYPETPGWSNDTTSRAAALKVDHLSQKAIVYNYIINSFNGATADEIVEATGLLNKSVSARCTDLYNAGLIVPNGERMNNLGNNCLVYIKAPEGTQPITRPKTYKELTKENAELKEQLARCGNCSFRIEGNA